MPDQSSGWVLLLISAVACVFALRVNQNSLTPRKLCALMSSTTSLTPPLSPRWISTARQGVENQSRHN
jgi:hypothetical protein